MSNNLSLEVPADTIFQSPSDIGLQLSPEQRTKLDDDLKIIEERQHLSVFGHPYWRDAATQALGSIAHKDAGCMSVIVGPTGVGKSTLMRELEKHLKAKLATGSTSDIPVIFEEIVPNAYGPFNWKDFYARILSKLNLPLTADLKKHPTDPSIVGRLATLHVLRRAFEESTKARNTKVILLDEAQHVALGRMAKGMLEQLEVLKSMANMCGVHLILSGPYTLLSSMRLSGQLARRITTVHFPRYKMSAEGLGAFRDVLCGIIAEMQPWTFDVDLESITEVEYFCKRALGCIGILRPWLLRAVRKSAGAGTWHVTKECLDQTALGSINLRIILDEIEEGENLLVETPKDWSALEKRLEDNTGQPEVKVPAEKKKGNRFPGEAAPRRYPTESDISIGDSLPTEVGKPAGDAN